MATATEEAMAPAVVVEAPPAPEKVAQVMEQEPPKAEEEAPKLEEEGEKKVEEAPKPEEGEVKETAEQGEKKATKPRKRKPRSAGPHHPPYFEMIREAILALDGKSAASPYAIAKYMGEKHRDELPANYRKVLAVQLRNFAAKGRLVKVKASYKLAAAEEKKKAAPAAKKKEAAPAAKKTAAPAAKNAGNAKRKWTAWVSSGGKKAAAPAASSAPVEPKKARAKRARKAAPAPAPPKPKQHKSVRAAGTKKANKAHA